MDLNIGTLPTAAITFVVSSGVFAMAWTVFTGIRLLARRPSIDKAMTAVSPQLLATVAILFALLTGFLGNNVWSNATQAHRAVAEEARSLNEALLLGKGLNDDLRTAVRLWIVDYVDAVAHQEWPAMAEGSVTDRPYAILYQAVEAVMMTEPANQGETVAQNGVVHALNDALAARNQRLNLSDERVGDLKWTVMLALGTLVLISVGLLHHGNAIALAISVGIASTAISAALIPIVAYDRPFAGERAIPPTPLLHLTMPKD